MSHDTEAQAATQKLAVEFSKTWQLCFSKKTVINRAYASIPKRNVWPVPDGAISLKAQAQKTEYALAIEYKRPEEGKHGILTALGQSISYIENGRFAASIIVVPESYSSKDKRSPGDFLKSVIQFSAPGQPIGVWVYDSQKNLKCVLPIKLDKQVTKSPKKNQKQESLPNKQWMYVRSGEFNPDTVYKYLKTAKQLAPETKLPPLHPEIKKACQRLGIQNPEKALSDSPHDKPEDKIWRKFWYTYWFTKDVQTIWKKKRRKYLVNNASCDIFQWNKTNDGKGIKMVRFAGRSDSKKETLVKKLNAHTITEKKAWEEFVSYIAKKAAHSAKETVDSSINQLRLVDEFGNPTQLGYQFVDEANKQPDSAFGTICVNILRYAMLTAGGYFNFLKNLHELSEKKFTSNTDEFWKKKKGRKNPEFDKNEYLKWIEDEFVQNLCIMYKQKNPTRGKKKTTSVKTSFQDDMTILKQFGFISGDFRRGLGLQINWPFIHESMNTDNIQ